MSRDHLLKPECTEGLGMGEDLWIEIAHGPTLVDNNIMLSERCVRIAAQGIAFVHNLFYGALTGVGRGVCNGTEKLASPRFTPIHKPHSTDITGFMTVLHGDVRFYNNVFVQPEVRQGMADLCSGDGDEWDDLNLLSGTIEYNGYMKEDEWKGMFDGYCGEGAEVTRDRYYMPLPVWTGGNAFFNGAKPCDIEEDCMEDTGHNVKVELVEENGNYKVVTDIGSYLKPAKLISSATLGEAFEPEERFETSYGEDIIFDTDIDGKKRGNEPVPGPFA